MVSTILYGKTQVAIYGEFRKIEDVFLKWYILFKN